MKYAVVISILLVTGCAAPSTADRYLADISSYENQMLTPSGLNTPLPAYWANHAAIAEKYGRTSERKLFVMLQMEASKNARGEKNDYGSFVRRYLSGDQSLFGTADGYFLTLASHRECASFGYQPDSPDFNKCAFDVRARLLSLQMQQDQLVTQMLMYTQPAPLPLPRQTKCTTNGNQTTCTSL